MREPCIRSYITHENTYDLHLIKLYTASYYKGHVAGILENKLDYVRLTNSCTPRGWSREAVCPRNQINGSVRLIYSCVPRDKYLNRPYYLGIFRHFEQAQSYNGKREMLRNLHLGAS